MSEADKQRAVLRAQELHRLIGSSLDRSTIPSNETLLSIGKSVWEYSYKLTDDDHEALNWLAEYIDSLKFTQPDLYIRWKYALTVPNEQIITLWAARWVDQACPRIVIDDKFAALLAATDAGMDMVDHAIPPWKAFLIDMPQGFIPVYYEAEKTWTRVQKILVHNLINDKGESVWSFMAMTPEGVELWRHGVQGEDFFDKTLESMWSDTGLTLKLKSRDARSLLLVSKLIISTCIAMSDPNNFREQKRSKGRRAEFRRRRLEGGPSIRSFILGKPTKLDCRTPLCDFVKGTRKGSKVSVQFLVRGHWKRQAYGPNRSLRKTIHVAPYWKGPEEGKVVAKSIHLTR